MCLQILYRGSFLFTRKRQRQKAPQHTHTHTHTFSSCLISRETKFPYPLRSPGLRTPDTRLWGRKIKLLGSMPINTWDLGEYHEFGARFEKSNQ
jgi:hypothetical protein